MAASMDFLSHFLIITLIQLQRGEKSTSASSLSATSVRIVFLVIQMSTESEISHPQAHQHSQTQTNVVGHENQHNKVFNSSGKGVDKRAEQLNKLESMAPTQNQIHVIHELAFRGRFLSVKATEVENHTFTLC